MKKGFEIIKDSTIYGFGDFFAKLLSFFTFPIIASYLKPADYGKLEIIATIVSILYIIIEIGLNNSFQRYFWEENSNEYHNTLIKSGLYQIFISIILLLFLLSGLFFISKITIYFKGIMELIIIISLFITISSNLIINFTKNVLRVHFKPYKFLIISIVSRILNVSFSLYVIIFLGKGVNYYYFASSISFLFIIPLCFYFLKKSFKYSVNKKMMMRNLKFGYPFIFTNIAFWLYASLDKWMIKSFLGFAETGVYSISFRFLSILMFILIAFGQAWNPIAYKEKKENPKGYRKFYSNVLYILIIIILVIGGFLALFSGEIIYLFLNKSYYGSGIPLIILIIGIVFYSTIQITGLGITLEERTDLFGKISWICVIINVLGNYLLIKKYGIIGASIATTITYFFISFLYLYFCQKLHKIPINYYIIIYLLLLSVILFLISFYFYSTEINYKIIILKFSSSIVLLALALISLPKDLIKRKSK